jgi:uncharacterized damage-inducible protein DinB
MSTSDRDQPSQPAADLATQGANYAAVRGTPDPLRSFRAGPARYARAIAGVPAELLVRQPARGGWSVRDVLAHLADGEVMIGSRLRLMAAMERPTLVGYDQDAFVERLGVERRSAAQLLEAFRAMRALNVDLLERLPQDAWSRTGWHSERGLETVAQNLAMYAGHDHVHEAQVARVLAEVQGSAR